MSSEACWVGQWTKLFSQDKRQKFPKTVVKISNEFCSTCQWSWTDSWLFLSSFFFFVSMKAQKYIDCSRHLEKLLQNWGRRSRQGGGGKEEIFFHSSPVPFLYFNTLTSRWQEKISIMVCTAKYSCFAGYHLLSSNCFHKSKGSLFSLPWTHTPSGTIFLWPGRVLF